MNTVHHKVINSFFVIELRTPLGAIIGALSAFEGTPLRPDQRDMVEVMTRASDVVLSVVNDILDAARLEAQKLTLINRTFDKNIAMFASAPVQRR